MIRISFKDNRTSFAPGDAIVGEVEWSEPDPLASAEVKLCWLTRGKGTEDSECVETVPLHSNASSDRRPFRLQAPESPYSFSGRLISLVWVVECVLQPDERYERTEIVIAPNGQEIVLPNANSASEVQNPIAAVRSTVS